MVHQKGFSGDLPTFMDVITTAYCCRADGLGLLLLLVEVHVYRCHEQRAKKSRPTSKLNKIITFIPQ